MILEQIQKEVEEIFNAYKEVDKEYDMGFINAREAQQKVKEKIKTILDQHTANTWKAALNTILESGLLEEKSYFASMSQEIERDTHNETVKAIREYINKLKQ